MSEYICDISNDKVALEVYECYCGFHIGVDSSFLEQVQVPISVECPACGDYMICGSSENEEKE